MSYHMSCNMSCLQVTLAEHYSWTTTYFSLMLCFKIKSPLNLRPSPFRCYLFWVVHESEWPGKEFIVPDFARRLLPWSSPAVCLDLLVPARMTWGHWCWFSFCCLSYFCSFFIVLSHNIETLLNICVTIAKMHSFSWFQIWENIYYTAYVVCTYWEILFVFMQLKTFTGALG